VTMGVLNSSPSCEPRDDQCNLCQSKMSGFIQVSILAKLFEKLLFNMRLDEIETFVFKSMEMLYRDIK